MTNTSDRPPRSGSLYSRFIPREELQSFKAWMPGSFESPNAQAPRLDLSAEEHGKLLAAARDEGRAQGRREGYEGGYRDGMAALESFKQQHATKMEAQVGELLQSIDAQFQALEESMAQAVAEAATRLARAMLRTELHSRPEVVAAVAQEAVGTMLSGARQLRVLVHPEDEPLVLAGAGLLLESRGARVLASPTISRGGCVVESELGRIDARIEQRWAQATQLLGAPQPWSEPAAAAPSPTAQAAATPEAAAAQEPDFELDMDLGDGPAAPGAA